jgi:menaquinone-specific isochorismate synthase
MEGDLVQSEAVAGTAGIEKRGGEAGSLANLGPKERAEHQFVVSAVVDRLSQVSKDITWDKEPQIVSLHDLVHLVTPIRAALRQRVDPLEILGLLHPTPAVCGTPSAAAREFIRVHEPFDRGWYAGTIGYMNAERSEFAVSLRSALLEQESLSAFVGAGIVSGSVAASEWDELNLKQRRIEEMVANKG